MVLVRHHYLHRQLPVAPFPCCSSEHLMVLDIIPAAPLHVRMSSKVWNSAWPEIQRTLKQRILTPVG
jgi:hypothetical protein